MAQQSEHRPASHEEIYAKLNHYAGQITASEIDQIVHLLNGGQTQPALERLAVLDATIGGFGIHSLVNTEEREDSPYPIKDRPVYRPLQYVQMHLTHPHPEWYARDIAEMACAHIEGLVKRFVEQRNLIERFRRSPLGALLHNHRVESVLPPPLWQDLCWLNNAVYTHVKHDFDFRREPDAMQKERKDHLFAVDEALAVYVIARHLAVEITRATR